MKIISYLDNDQLNQPRTGGAPVYAAEEQGPLSVQQLTRKYPTVFGGGVGRLQGPYHIRLDDSISPVQQASRRVPVAMRDLLRHTLRPDGTRDHLSSVGSHTLDQLHGHSSEKGRLPANLCGPERPKLCHTEGALSSPDYKGCHHPTPWGEVLYRP